MRKNQTINCLVLLDNVGDFLIKKNMSRTSRTTIKCEDNYFCGAYLQSETRCPHSAQSHSRCHRRPADPAHREAPQQPSRGSRSPGCSQTCRDRRNALNTRANRCSHNAPTLSCAFAARLHAGLPSGAPTARGVPRSPSSLPWRCSHPRPLTRGAAAAAHAPAGPLRCRTSALRRAACPAPPGLSESSDWPRVPGLTCRGPLLAHPTFYPACHRLQGQIGPGVAAVEPSG